MACLPKVMMQRSNIIRDGFVVVIQHNDQVFLQAAGIINRLQGHTAGEGTIANNCDNLCMFTFEVTSGGQAQCRRNGCTGMAGSKYIIRALLTPQVARKPAKLTYGMETVTTTGE